MSVTERLHMISDLEEKYTIELDREYHRYGNEGVRDLPPLGHVADPYVGKSYGP